MKLGEDFTGGFFRRIYAPSNPAGLWYALAVAVGLTPEMLPMIVSVCLSRGAIAMSRKKVIVKRLGLPAPTAAAGKVANPPAKTPAK